MSVLETVRNIYFLTTVLELRSQICLRISGFQDFVHRLEF
jgi:hypothetical protein